LLSAELIPLQHLSAPTDMPKSQPALPCPMRQDSLAERSKAVVTGVIPKGRGLEPHSFHLLRCCWRGEQKSRLASSFFNNIVKLFAD
jgi:hypothetical protein